MAFGAARPTLSLPRHAAAAAILASGKDVNGLVSAVRPVLDCLKPSGLMPGTRCLCPTPLSGSDPAWPAAPLWSPSQVQAGQRQLVGAHQVPALFTAASR